MIREVVRGRPAAKTENTIAPKVIWLRKKVNVLKGLFGRTQPDPISCQHSSRFLSPDEPSFLPSAGKFTYFAVAADQRNMS